MPASTGNSAKRGPGRPAKKDPPPPLDDPFYESVRERYSAEFGLGNDICAEIAQALFLGNRQALYKVFGDKLMQGNVKVLEALANRAYGMPNQRVQINREPFRLEIVHVGSIKQPETIEVKIAPELTEGEPNNKDEVRSDSDAAHDSQA